MVKVQEKRRVRNLAVRSAVKTAVKKAQQEIAAGRETEAKALMTKAYSELDKAVAKGIIHKNQAGNKKSRLAIKLNKSRSEGQS
jgi:small subunit ribosomal protein S20